ncbi:MAG TPA: DUF2142 domain-containing protein [Solirubrobacteraceae bacterium]|nr:DUF2142 domain-containing protein [Solirubrobacteraceae bacterium]
MSSSYRLSGAVVWTAGIAVLSALYMGLVVPIGFGPDETEHILRAYQLSLGHVLPQVVDCTTHRHLFSCHGHLTGRLVPKRRAGGNVSYALLRVLNRIYGVSHNKGRQVHFRAKDYAPLLGISLGSKLAFGHFENTALYSPVNYIPATVVFWIARQVNEPVIAAIFAARLLTGLAWATVVTAAVAIAPRWKWLFSLVVLVPTALSQATVVSADSAALAIVTLTTAYALHLADRGDELRRREIAALSVLGILVGLLKFPLVLVLVAILALLGGVLGSGATRRWRAAVIAVPGLLAAVWWDLASNTDFVPYRNVVYQAAQRMYISQPGQEHYLLAHLLKIPALFWNTATAGALFKLNEVAGTVGEWGLPEWFGIAWLVLFLVLACANTEGPPLGRGIRGWVGGTLVTYFLATAIAIYITWTAVGDSQISGMHGRYFTLVLVLAVPLFAGIGARRLRINPRISAYSVIAISALSAGWMFSYTAQRYYAKPPWWVFAHVTSVLF